MKKHVVLLFLTLLLLSACNPSKNKNINKTVENNNSMEKEYHTLTETDNLGKFLGKKVSFEGKISVEINQHMMKGYGPDNESKQREQYFDPLEKYTFGQLVVYYPSLKVKWPEEKDKTVRVYGTVGEVSGAGKGGGTHSEYYIDADKVEF